MSEKATMVRDAERAFGELRSAIDGLSDEDMRRVWLGTWGVREILIHISGWHDEMAAALSRVAKGDAPYSAGTYDDFDAWNARFVDQKAGVKTADVLADLDASHQKLLGAAAAPRSLRWEASSSASTSPVFTPALCSTNRAFQASKSSYVPAGYGGSPCPTRWSAGMIS